MKNIIFILIVILAGVFIYLARQDHTLPADKLIVFSQEHCPHCHEALAFIDSQIRPDYPSLEIEIRDISNRAHMNGLLSLANDKKWDKNTIGTPVIVLGETALVGWTAANEMRLKSAVRRFMSIPSDIPTEQAAPIKIEPNEPAICQPGDVENCID